MFSHLFVQWKFAFLSLSRPEYLQDSDIVFNRFQVCLGFFTVFLSSHLITIFLEFYFYAKWCFNLFLYTLQRRDVYGAWEQYLGLEHSDNTPKRAYVNQVLQYC